jgi:hypothetical protein
VQMDELSLEVLCKQKSRPSEDHVQMDELSVEVLCKQKSRPSEDHVQMDELSLEVLCKQKSRPLEDLCKKKLSFGGPKTLVCNPRSRPSCSFREEHGGF